MNENFLEHLVFGNYGIHGNRDLRLEIPVIEKRNNILLEKYC